MFINLTNHLSAKWGEEQIKAAMQHGEIEDVPFPMVSPNATHEEIQALAEELHQSVMEKHGNNITAVHIMGEFTLCYALVQLFKAGGIMCLSSTTERSVTDNPDGTKTSTFRFVQFREY
ncbi:MAG: CRISPR-associated protein [Prevotellaceae bacterium]|nr:CRISPR-associated protein [Candidatus Minthosoma caballi]